jgi:glycosyltransferase involved in cell wall biosynthesis
MTRRLLQAMAGAPQGGAEIFFVRLAAALQRAGEAQRVLIRRHGERAGQLREAGVAVVEAGFRGPFDLMTKAAFRREIAGWRPTLVLTWMSRATQLCPSGDFVHVARLGGYYDLKYYRGCDHLVGNTRAIAAYAVGRGWAEDRVHYLPNFVPDLAGVEAVARAEAATPEDVPLALALGRLHPNKGFDLLLDAIAATRNVHLWLAGDGPLRTALERQADRLGIVRRVRFLGWRDDVARLLASVDFLVSPSRHEPLGNVVIEAWSAEVPVIATATDGPAALIEPGRTGLVVPIEASALAEAMDALAHDGARRARLGAAGRAAYEAEFTEAAVVAAYRGLFDRMAA